MTDLANWRRIVNRRVGEYRQVKVQLAKETADLEENEQEQAAVDEATKIVQSIAQSIQQRVHRQIADVVSLCLTAVFEEPYAFSIRFERKRDRTEAVMVFSRDGVELDDPLNEIGGGVVDVASLALRLASILLARPSARAFLALDEPFKNVRGEGNRARTRVMLERLADDLGVQVLLNTDIEEYRLGTIVELPL
jgi:DNA repair exonuclease SbcCD ATPase subunit